MFITEANPAIIANLWQRLRAMLARASAVIGPLPALASMTALTRSRRREIVSCLALLEACARKLILIAAAELHRADRDGANPSRLPHLEVVAPSSTSWSARFQARIGCDPRIACALGSVRSNLQAFDPTKPETWRVRFNLAPPRDPMACPAIRAPRIRALSGPTPTPPLTQTRPRDVACAPLRLAIRFEALRRVIAGPAPYARRLARLLPRLAAAFAMLPNAMPPRWRRHTQVIDSIRA